MRPEAVDQLIVPTVLGEPAYEDLEHVPRGSAGRVNGRLGSVRSLRLPARARLSPGALVGHLECGLLLRRKAAAINRTGIIYGTNWNMRSYVVNLGSAILLAPGGTCFEEMEA